MGTPEGRGIPGGIGIPGGRGISEVGGMACAEKGIDGGGGGVGTREFFLFSDSEILLSILTNFFDFSSLFSISSLFSNSFFSSFLFIKLFFFSSFINFIFSSSFNLL